MEKKFEQGEVDNNSNPCVTPDEEVDLYGDLDKSASESPKKDLFSSPRTCQTPKKKKLPAKLSDDDDVDLYEDLELFEKQLESEEVLSYILIIWLLLCINFLFQ